MRNKQAKALRKAIRENLKKSNLSPEKYGEVRASIYKMAKKQFKNTPWNKRDKIQID